MCTAGFCSADLSLMLQSVPRPLLLKANVHECIRLRCTNFMHLLIVALGHLVCMCVYGNARTPLVTTVLQLQAST